MVFPGFEPARVLGKMFLVGSAIGKRGLAFANTSNINLNDFLNFHFSESTLRALYFVELRANTCSKHWDLNIRYVRSRESTVHFCNRTSRNRKHARPSVVLSRVPAVAFCSKGKDSHRTNKQHIGSVQQMLPRLPQADRNL